MSKPNNNTNKFNRQPAPPPPMFTGIKEKDFYKQVVDEAVERVAGQEIVYYSIDLEHSNIHSVYGESLEKTFLSPIHLYTPVLYQGYEITQTIYGIDKRIKLQVHFHYRRIKEDIDLFVREGDFIAYGDRFFEIISTEEPELIFGQYDYKVEVVANCIETREGIFNAE